MTKQFAKSLSVFCATTLLVFSCIQPVSAYSSIANIEGHDATQLKKLGITVNSWKHDTIGEVPPQRWVEVTYDCSKLQKDRNVLMTLEVISDVLTEVPAWQPDAEKGKPAKMEKINDTISACRAEHKIGETDKLKLLFFIREQNIENSHVQIITISDDPADPSNSLRENPGFGGYSLSVKRILQLAGDHTITEELPTAEQVKSVSVEFKHPKLKDIEFNASAEDWKLIRSNLLPAEPDPKPAKWEWLGTVKIVNKDGHPFLIELYETSDGPGAFAIGTKSNDLRYYRGGDTGDLIDALSRAFENSKKSTP